MRFIVILTLSIALVAETADARPTSISKQYETDKRLGIGLMLGIPLGLDVKFLATETIAIDLGIGAYIAYRDRTGLHIHADVLYHPFVAVEGESFLAPLYAGLGARFLNYDDYTHIGIRVPVGIAFDFGSKAFDIFLEGAFVYDVSVSGGDPAVETPGAVDINVMTGVRFFVF